MIAFFLSLIKKSIKVILTHQVQKVNLKTRFNVYCEDHLDIIPSRKGVKKAIQKGELRLNGEKVEGGRWLQEKDVITYVDLENTPPKTYHLKLDVIYEDEDLAVILKPAGISVSGNQFKTVQNALQHNITPSNKSDKLAWPLPVHRLDNPTAGLLIIAKTKMARVKLGQAFEQKNIAKTYHAVVMGKIDAEGTINSNVADKNALTAFRRLTFEPSLRSEFLSLVELYPATGRTHQLRIHCAAIGHPILGDKIYGPEGNTLKHKGLFLCAVKLTFNHPITDKKIELSISTPEKFLKRLENEARRYQAKQANGKRKKGGL